MSAPTIDSVPPTEQAQRTGLAKWIRRLAIPIILGWIALIAVLNVTVPQLEVVGQMRSVSMSPKEAPSVIAMKRVGKVFEEFEFRQLGDDRAGGRPAPRRRRAPLLRRHGRQAQRPTPSTSSTFRTSGATR